MLEDGYTLYDWCKKNNSSIIDEWDYDKNDLVTPKDVKKGTKRKVWWICSQGHSYMAQILNRISGTGCPYCAGKKVLPGFNDLESLFPDLASEWDYDKNSPLTPKDVVKGSEKYVYWICPNGHSYETRISNRVHGTNCPYCAGKKVLPGFNDLASCYPELAEEWDVEKNSPLTPAEVTIGSKRKIWWKCKEGHSYYSSIGHRTKDKRGCPYCTNQRILPGFNDLASTRPELLQYWDYEKNGELSPSSVMKAQKRKVWWKGKCGHSWQASLNNMNSGRNCPICAKEQKTSFQEQAVYFYVKSVFKDAINGERILLSGKELDVYIPSKRIAIEFDGRAWHKSATKDERKNELCCEKGINLYRIRDDRCPKLKQCNGVYIIGCHGDSDKDLQDSIIQLFSLLQIEADINIERDKNAIYSQYINKIKAKSLAESFPEIAKEWDYEKNGNLTPDLVNPGTNKKVWWKCSKGHSWQATIGSRSAGNGCAVCSQKRVWTGYNDLASLSPELASEWNYEKNGKLLPSQITLHSNKRVWWKCKKGHEWEATVNNRSKGRTCPFCRESRCIKVINLDTGEIFESIGEAAETIDGKSKGNISSCCAGKRPTAGGFHWAYYKE